MEMFYVIRVVTLYHDMIFTFIKTLIEVMFVSGYYLNSLVLAQYKRHNVCSNITIYIMS